MTLAGPRRPPGASQASRRRDRRPLWGLLAALLWPVVGAAQVQPPPDTTPPRPDSAVIQIPAPADSAAAPVAAPDTTPPAPDTVAMPIAAPPLPTEHTIGPAYAWDRDQLFASGAHSLLDLLEQVPGVTGMRVGWLLPPEYAAYDGAFGRIRLFLDGVELAPITARSDGLFDLSAVDLWPLEEVRVERGAGELRVHMRSWTVESTTADTRTDVATGQYRTNLFRGFYGQRFGHGELVQFGFQQFSTGDPERGGDGDQLSLMGRLGWASGEWSVDAFGLRRSRSLTSLQRLDDLTELRGMEGVQQFGYLRAGYRAPTMPGMWLQAIASSDAFIERSEHQPEQPPFPADSADTTRSRPQYVVAGGWNGGPVRVTASGRMSTLDGERYFTPTLRGEVDWRWVSLAALGERRAEDSTTRAEVTAELRPLPWATAVVSVGRVMPAGDEDPRATTTPIRGEVGVRLDRAWLVAGALRSGSVASGAPSQFDPTFESRSTGTDVAVYGGVRGPVWRDLSADVVVTRWMADAARAYRPQQQVRAAVTLDTRWLSRFPRGEFGLRASAAASYRSSVFFPVSDEGGYQTLGSTSVQARLEIRIQQAVAFVESRNTLALDYDLVPGFAMPRNVLLYGVRWQFWN